MDILHKEQTIAEKEKQASCKVSTRSDTVKNEPPKDRSYYIPLYKAALRGDWDSAEAFINRDSHAITAKIGLQSTTALHIVVGTGRAVHFVENLVDLMPTEALTLQDAFGNTALNTAALVGNTKAATILVKKNRALLHIRHENGFLPVQRAALNAHKDTLRYLLECHYKDDINPGSLGGESGADLLISVIDSGYFDVALDLVQHYPNLATLKDKKDDSALNALARKASAFPSGSYLKFWEDLIYSNIPIKVENYFQELDDGDIEDPVNNSRKLGQMCSSSISCRGNQYRYVSVWQRLNNMFWESIKLLVPKIKDIEDRKAMNYRALYLVEILCKEIQSLNNATICGSLYEKPFLQAAKLGIHEIVEIIVAEFPDAVYSRDENGHYMFEVAVIHRCENIFNLIYQMSDYKQYTTLLIDSSGNNILHLAARLAPSHKLNLVPGAALQMQSEIKWFKEVERFVIPTYKNKLNSAKETPAMVFTREHKDLVIEGEKWMKDTANSCTIAAALIVTVAFAASITVPGGNQKNGLPVFHKEKAFQFFCITDSISLFTSCTSLLMFLSILTSRYSEYDFRYVLPRRLVIGLLTLFLSITTMMMAFSATLYLLFEQRMFWRIVPLVALASLPVTSFIFLQFPLLIDIIHSTHRPSSFGQKSDHPFY